MEIDSHAAPAESLLMWFIDGLGLFYLAAIVGTAVFAGLLTLVVVLRGKGTMAAAALILIPPCPLWIGMYSATEGLLRALFVLQASETEPRLSELCAGASTALIGPAFGMLLMAPIYALAVFGSLLRSQFAEATNSSR